ncbi:hypothetical protein D3C75_1226840 [compost metagenome]
MVCTPDNAMAPVVATRTVRFTSLAARVWMAFCSWVRSLSLGVRPAATITASNSSVTELPQVAGISEPACPVLVFSSTNLPPTKPTLGVLFG